MSTLMLALATSILYFPGLHGDFEFDDGPNIIDNEALKLEQLTLTNVLKVAMSGMSGPLGRSVSMVTFAGNYYLTGFDPFYFKLTNLLIHLFAGAGVYALARQLSLALGPESVTEKHELQAHQIALTATAIWLVHPLNVTSVLYVVQRMTSLSALFTFWAVALYIFGRRKTLDGKLGHGLFWMLTGLVPVSMLAIFSKENGALAPCLTFCVEVVVFRFAAPSKVLQLSLYGVFFTFLILAATLLILRFDQIYNYVINGYLQRDFSLADRLSTQPGVLLFYLRLLVLPSASAMGLYHDDFPVVTNFFESPQALFSALSIGALLVTGIFAIRRAPPLAFAILWYFVGHSMESTFLALEMVHEHRNYLPIVGPIFAASYYLWMVGAGVLSTKAKLAISGAIFVVFSGVTYVRSVQWSNLVDHAAIEAHNHPQSERANYQMGRVYFMLNANEKNPEMSKLADQYFERAAKLGSINIYPMAGRLQLAFKDRTPPPKHLVEEIARRLQFGRAWDANLSALNNLVNCQMTQYCRFTDEEMTSMLKAPLANAGFSPKARGAAHWLLGGYYAARLGDFQAAKPQFEAAVEAEPNRIEYRLELVRFYGVLQDLDAAEAQLKVARKLDTLGIQRNRLDEEAALLESARRAQLK
ncbi:MAG: tetratricopeptide repeat protein [Betaproteobacteria bacterium]